MDENNQILRLSDHEGVDRLNSLDRYLRQNEGAPLTIDLCGKDHIPTSILQMIICASIHWTQRDLSFSILGQTDEMKENLQTIGADLESFMIEEPAV